MAERHRLTITVSMSLYEQLCQLAGPRRLSQWMEDAAWRKIISTRDEAPTETEPDRGGKGMSSLHGLPPPPWRWSPLRPPQSMETGEDLLDL
jgi:hypothetical protein